jgi:hypothetical protein
LQFSDWYAAAQVDNLEPVDDLGVCADQRARQGAARLRICRQAKRPVDRGSDRHPDYGADPVRRIDYLRQFVGFDVTRMYPAGAPPDTALTDAWTWDGFLVAAQKCAAAGMHSALHRLPDVTIPYAVEQRPQLFPGKPDTNLRNKFGRTRSFFKEDGVGSRALTMDKMRQSHREPTEDVHRRCRLRRHD